MTQGSGDQQAVTYDAAGRVACDLPCVGCGYNLRTQMGDGQCPECGSSVKRSVLVARLRFADPVWLRSMSYSVFWLTIGVVVLVISPLLLLIDEPGLLLHAVVIAVPAVTVVLGAWQATTREPGVSAPLFNLLRRSARLGLVSGVAMMVLAPAVFALAIGPNTHGAGWVEVIALLGFVALLFGVGAGLLVGLRVAMRIKSKRLMWGFLLEGLGLVGTLGVTGGAVVVLENWSWGWKFERWLDRRGVQIDFAGFWDTLWDLAEWTVGEHMLLIWSLPVWGAGLMALLLWYRARLRDAAGMATRLLNDEG